MTVRREKLKSNFKSIEKKNEIEKKFCEKMMNEMNFLFRINTPETEKKKRFSEHKS